MYHDNHLIDDQVHPPEPRPDPAPHYPLTDEDEPEDLEWNDHGLEV